MVAYRIFRREKRGWCFWCALRWKAWDKSQAENIIWALEFCERRKWLDALAQKKPNAATLGNELEKYFDEDQAELRYLQWIRHSAQFGFWRGGSMIWELLRALDESVKLPVIFGHRKPISN